MDGPSVLAQVPLFAELTAAEGQALGRSLQRRPFARGEVIFQQGDPGSSLYIIESGRIKIVLASAEGRELILALLGPADFFGDLALLDFGDLALLDGEPRSADAVARESGQLLVLRREDFLRFLGAHPEAATRLLAILSRRLRRNAQLIQDAAFLDIPARLARVILDLARPSTADPARLTTSSRLTQTDLAAMVGATRESVNKWLRTCQRRGLIRLERGRITVLSPEGLRHYIH